LPHGVEKIGQFLSVRVFKLIDHGGLLMLLRRWDIQLLDELIYELEVLGG